MSTFNNIVIRIIIISVITVSCGKSDDESYCTRLLDTSNMNLYSFDPFTEDEWKMMPYSEKLEKRQVPDNILPQMSNIELFYQFITCDLSRNTYIFNTALKGFRQTYESLNSIQELMKRPDVGLFLINMVNSINITKLNDLDCFHLNNCAQFALVQPEVINTFNDLDLLAGTLFQLEEKILKASVSHSDNWKIPFSLTAPVYGYGIIMMKYNFTPFTDLVESNEDVAQFMNMSIDLNMNTLSSINECMEKFYHKH